MQDEKQIEPILISLDKRGGRLLYMKKIDDTLAEKIFMIDNTVPSIFPRMQLDQRTVHRNILNKRKPTVFQQVAKFHHKFGIRHYLLVMVLALYALFGGLMFLTIEAKNERIKLEKSIEHLDALMQNLTKALFELTNVNYTESLQESAVFIIR
jgi:hypothetical protein